MDAFGLERPSDTIDDVLIDVAKRIGAFMKGEDTTSLLIYMRKYMV